MFLGNFRGLRLQSFHRKDDMSTHHSKTLNRAIHPHFTTKYTREVNTFFNKIFHQVIPPMRIKTSCAYVFLVWN